MSGVNKVIIVGRLGKDPELRQAGSHPVASFTVATSEQWTDKKNGQKQEKTEWHKIVVWGKQAEHCAEYLSKGRQVYIEGRLQTREWEKDGAKKYMTEIVAQQVIFLGDGAGKGGGHEEPPPNSGSGSSGDDEMPPF